MRHVLAVSLLATATAAAAGCSDESVIAARQIDAAIRSDVDAVAQGNNQVACDLYAKLTAGGGNTFFSPFSITTALAMLDAGAAGATDAELRSALKLQLPGERAHAAYGALLESLQIGRDFGQYTLASANRLFGQDGYDFLPSFLGITREHYGAELMPVDFQRDAEGARQIVNGWVKDQTEGKIEELFEPGGGINANTRLVLANAIVFKGRWEGKFDSAQARPFRLAGGTTIDVPIMQKRDRIGTGSIPGGRIGVLPFGGKDLSMLVLLPSEPSGLPAIEQAISGAKLAEWVGSVHVDDEPTSVMLPKFSLESKIDLEATLRALGIVTAFESGSADFSAMNGRRDLFVQKTVHRAVIAVDENGAEAAAATGVSVGRDAAVEGFEVDRPFLFAIYDHVTGSVLFMGRVMDPRPGA